MHRWWIAAAIVLGCVRGAAADGTGVVAASASRTTDRGAVAIAVSGAIGGGARRVVDDAVGRAREALAAGAVPIATLARFRRVRDLIDEGWRAYLHVDLELAYSRLAVARTEAEALVALAGGDVLYADAALRLGLVLAQQGHTDDARAAIGLGLALDPERPVTLAEFSPDEVKLVDGVRATVPATRRQAIASEPAGALISVDGKPLGAAPVAAELAIGQHVAIARAPGFAPRAQAFAIGERGELAEVRLPLERDDEAARVEVGAIAGLAETAAEQLVAAALRYAELDDVVLAVATDRRGGEALLVQRCAPGISVPGEGSAVRCTAVVEIGYARGGLAAAGREAWQAVRGAELRYPPSVLGDPRVAGPTTIAHRCEWCRSPYVWGGAAAVAIATTIVVIAVVSASRPPPTVGVDPGTFVTK